MEIDKTSRGFDIAKFKDRYGADCSLQKSSLAGEDCIWLGLNGNDPEAGSRMHLTREMVANLMPALQRFVDTGKIS